MRTFIDPNEPNRFWNIELKGKSYTVTSGKAGSKGRGSTKGFADEASARKAHARLIRKKLGEGFAESTPEAATSLVQRGLEAALAESPDDLVAHAAYADCLQEQGNPRGELIQVQLALEKDDLPSSERDKLKAWEKELLAQVEDDCLGTKLLSLRLRRGTGSLAGWQPYAFAYTIQRGWLTRVDQSGPFDKVLAQALADAPQARLLREFALHYRSYAAYLQQEDPQMHEVVGLLKPLKNLRLLYLGTAEEQGVGLAPVQDEPIIFNSRWELLLAGDAVWEWIAALPGLEELYLTCRTQNTARLFGLPSLDRLRILQLNLTDDYPLDVLASNPALKSLTHLSFHPLPNRDGTQAYLTAAHLAALARSPNLPALTHLRFQRSSAGDEGVRTLIDSGLLRRLEMLDLAMGTITAAGANLLAEADLGRLKVLDVSANAISPAGRQRLQTALQTKLTLRLGPQDAGAHPEWLYEGEME
jgi:uncharacterized protein (TIGR02996 family)